MTVPTTCVEKDVSNQKHQVRPIHLCAEICSAGVSVARLGDEMRTMTDHVRLLCTSATRLSGDYKGGRRR
jgi:hypothetical protein